MSPIENTSESRLIINDPLERMRSVFSGQGEVVRRYEQINAIFGATHGTKLLAKAIPAISGKNISWFISLSGDIRNYSELNDREKNNVAINI